LKTAYEIRNKQAFVTAGVKKNPIRTQLATLTLAATQHDKQAVVMVTIPSQTTPQVRQY